MSEKTTDNKLPYTCTSAYDRNACKGCVCSTCYEQEFCDRCSSCENQSKRKERCNAYEGAYNYQSSVFFSSCTKKSEYRCRFKRHTILRLYYEIILSAYSCSKLSASGFFSFFFLSFIPQLICSLFPAGCIFITFAAKVLCALRRLKICGFCASLCN